MGSPITGSGEEFGIYLGPQDAGKGRESRDGTTLPKSQAKRVKVRIGFIPSAYNPRWGNFIRVLESRLEGNTSIFVPVDRGGSKCFFNAVDVFIGKTKNPCITEIGRNYDIWFDLQGLKWILELFPKLNQRNPWAITRFETHRKLSISYGSNRWGNFIRVLESRLEGNTSIFVPVDRGGSKCFFNAVDVFIGKTKNPNIEKTLPATQKFTMVHEAHAPGSSSRHGSSGGMTLGGPPTDGFVANKTSDGTHPPKVPLPEFSPIDKAPAIILGGGNEISTDSQPTLEIGQVDDGILTEALQPGVSGARNQLQPGTPGELEPEDESIKPCLLNREEQLIIDGLFKHAPEMQVLSLDIPIQSELKLMMIDANVEESARGDLQKEFEILKPIFEQHISDDFEQSLCIIKEALRSPFVIEKIQKGLVKTLQGKAIKATRDAMKSAQCIRAIKLKGTRHPVLLSCANIDEPIITSLCEHLIDYE
ncbi:unnamed protein product [Cuscuta campestris]|uniref:Uncharacterized protein n=1 Tax=Cuscuta campestris TaxID=132261 RepID=A0A484NKC4_9ASTE|nr:unnamed protein product [Cuscuta campestris]